ncbi:MAG: hypothetical protein Q9M08_03125, partial [Mariprofundus sp.]|nr:hypothetical protein [Mariprofundus sp.]
HINTFLIKKSVHWETCSEPPVYKAIQLANEDTKTSYLHSQACRQGPSIGAMTTTQATIKCGQTITKNTFNVLSSYDK